MMLLDIVSRVYQAMRHKVFSREELDITHKSFDAGKFMITISICLLSASVIMEGYLIYGLARKYNDLNSEYINTMNMLEEKDKQYQQNLEEYRQGLQMVYKQFEKINDCLSNKKH